jgi:1-deoxy-D-xylulose-5-phosphate synthase
VVGVKMDKEPICLPIGKGELLSADSDENIDVCLIAVGQAVQSSLAAQKILKEKGLKTAVINARFIKPLDEKLILHWANRSGLIVTVEENAAIGGFGSGVLELLQHQHIQKDCLVMGLPDHFVDHASPKSQKAMTYLDGEGIAAKTMEKLVALDKEPKIKTKSKKAPKEPSISLQ